MSSPRMTDRSIELMVSMLLRTGVLIAGFVVLVGGVYFMIRHGGEQIDYRQFHQTPAEYRIVGQIVAGAIALRARCVIQLGVLLLIATPVARVALCLVGFAMEKDRHYLLITAIVLAVLLYSLISGAAHG
ncbi:MAG: DUF1634 domain-containing protein [Acidobacteriaceae bacterium]|nr:DUF1634 domain-containing protein [Acidobacteriaceae bacterium]